MFTFQLSILLTATLEILFSLLYPSACTRLNKLIWAQSRCTCQESRRGPWSSCSGQSGPPPLSLWQREGSHDGLGGEPVLGPLLVVSLGHVTKHHVSGLVDVMDDFAEVTLEISGSQTLKISKSLWRPM